MKTILLISFLLQMFPLAPFMVSGSSMEPALQSGDIFLAFKAEAGADFQLDDVVVFTLDDDPDYYYVKRIAALPGDEVTLRDVAREVPGDSYFVLGDNREESMDSRGFDDPFVPREQIIGTYFMRLFEMPVRVEQQLDARLIVSTEGGSVPFNVEIADEPEEVRTGLMNRDYMAPENGMLFIFDDARERRFWMKNTLIPLDIIFFDAEKRLISIVESVPPCEEDPCETYPSDGPAKYVLELNGGLSRELGISVGDTFNYYEAL